MNNIIQLLSDFLSGKQSNIEPLKDDGVTLAKEQQLAPIVYYQTKEKALYKAYLKAISDYTVRKDMLRQIDEAFCGIPYFTVKGIDIAEYYPIPQLRTMGDCDIVVHECDKEKAREALLRAGFEDKTGKWNDMEWHFEKQGLDFELHHRLLYDEVVNTKEEKALCDTAWDYVEENKLDINFQFAFAVIHLKKHLMNKGVGIRQFMDLAAMSKNAPLDKEKVGELLQKAGLLGFASVCSALCFKWFGIDLPVEKAEISEEFFNSATETVLANGVFGIEDEEKKMLNKVNKSGKYGTMIRHIFPSYYDCSITPKYKWIKGKPYLMPFLWIYRIFWALFNRKAKESIDYMSAVAESDEASAKRNKALSDWGL